jgi:cellobiose epimerase
MNDPGNSFPLQAAWQALPGEIEKEFSQILHYWAKYSTDEIFGGFAGRINQDNAIVPGAPKGSVLNSRILWTFSAAYRHTGNPLHLKLAARAYQYIVDFFNDPVYGGLYWSVDHRGKMLDGRKQIYAIAFGIYGMSEYYRASKDERALELALEWWQLIEKFSLDQNQGGYIDAFARNWAFLKDKRLSEKDENAPKTMNTHLHVVEAYANLFTVSPSEKLKGDILQLLNVFDEKIINKKNHHLGLFFSDDWEMDSTIISYGHDIEAGWLLQSCAESTGDIDAIRTAKKNALLITRAAMEGLDADGGLWYEYHNGRQELIREKHWWPQAEALVGFCNAWQLTGDSEFRIALLKNWEFIKNEILDHAHGEWFWGVDSYSGKITDQDKIGFWKCPYHNTRACLELIKRLTP